MARGVRKIRLSGGEPLVRRDFGALVRRIGRHLKSGTLQELTLTTNGTQLAHHAEMLADAGVRRDNFRSGEDTSGLQSLMRKSYAVLCLKKKKKYNGTTSIQNQQE